MGLRMGALVAVASGCLPRDNPESSSIAEVVCDSRLHTAPNQEISVVDAGSREQALRVLCAEPQLELPVEHTRCALDDAGCVKVAAGCVLEIPTTSVGARTNIALRVTSQNGVRVRSEELEVTLPNCPGAFAFADGDDEERAARVQLSYAPRTAGSCQTRLRVSDLGCRSGVPLEVAVVMDAVVPDGGVLCETRCDCGAGEVCRLGLCQPPPETCASNDDCPVGADGECAAHTCNWFTRQCEPGYGPRDGGSDGG